MASRQEKMERAEAAVKLAADDLKDVTREVKISTGPAYIDVSVAGGPNQQQQNRPGMIGSVVRAVQGTYEQAKETVVGKSQEAAESTRAGAERVSGKAGEYKDYVADKTKEAMNKMAQKTGEYKDSAAEKTVEYKDYTAEKAKEGKDATVSKLGELKDSALDGAKRAVSYLSGKKEETETASLGGRSGGDQRGSGGVCGRKVAEIEVEETAPGKVGATLKATDQMAGQAFNDVGPLGGGWEGKRARGG